MLLKRRSLIIAAKRIHVRLSVATLKRSVATGVCSPGEGWIPHGCCRSLRRVHNSCFRKALTGIASHAERGSGFEAATVGGSVNTSVVSDLPPPTHVKIVEAEYVKSSSSVKQCPQEKGAEFAVVGRSNVGKSSLINMLTGRRSLALVSKTPGKTRLINHFLINKTWYLVDLPGYGYARTSKEKRVEWNKFTKAYFLRRGTLANVLLLIDASVPPQQVDIDCANWLGEAEIPFSIVFTKTDKKKKKCPPVAQNIEVFKEKLLEEWEYLPATFATSSRTGAGKLELLQYIARLRNFFTETT